MRKQRTSWNKLKQAATSWNHLEWAGMRCSQQRLALENVRGVSCSWRYNTNKTETFRQTYNNTNI